MQPTESVHEQMQNVRKPTLTPNMHDAKYYHDAIPRLIWLNERVRVKKIKRVLYKNATPGGKPTLCTAFLHAK